MHNIQVVSDAKLFDGSKSDTDHKYKLLARRLLVIRIGDTGVGIRSL